MKYIQGQNRTQTFLFPVSIDDAVSADNEIRLIDVFVDNLGLESLGFQIDHGENGQDTNFGQCIITDLYVRSFPLIYYNLGDVLDTETKNGLTIINKIRGRQDDWIIFPDGERMPFHTFYGIMERRQEIKQFRATQEDY